MASKRTNFTFKEVCGPSVLHRALARLSSEVQMLASIKYQDYFQSELEAIRPTLITEILVLFKL